MTEPQERAAIAHLDFAATCGAKHRGRYCTNTAKWWVLAHKPNFCQHPSLDSNGNLEKLVCLYHLGQLEKLAEREVKKFRPLPRWIRWMVSDGDRGRCGSCGRTIQTPNDILQVVVGLS